jgi:hypothetical protein
MSAVITSLAGFWKMGDEDARAIVHGNMARLYAMTAGAPTPTQ